jgi:hypothetical protein
LRAWRPGSERFKLTQVLVELTIGLVDVSVFAGRVSTKLFLKFSDEIHQATGDAPWKDAIEFNLTGHVFDQRVRHPFGDVHNRLVFGERSQQNTTIRGEYTF